MGPLSELAIPLEHVIRTTRIRFIGMGPLSELAMPLERVIRAARIHFNSTGCFRRLGGTQMCGAPAPRLALK